MYVCMHTCTDVSVYLHVLVHALRIYVGRCNGNCAFVYVHVLVVYVVRMHVYNMRTHIYTCVYAHSGAYVPVYSKVLCVCLCTRVYACIYV